MDLIAHSVFLTALGTAIISSIWEMAALWLVFLLLAGRSAKLTPVARHNIALLLTGLGFLLFLTSVIVGYARSNSQIPSAGPTWLSNGLLSGTAIIGHPASKLLLPYLSSFYLIGLCILVIRYTRNYSAIARLRNTGLSSPSLDLQVFVAKIADRLDIQKKVSIFLSSCIDNPVTIGFVRPLILIPIATISQLTIAQLEAVLLHELAHIKRKDYLINLFISLTGTILFFNPFYRLLLNSIEQEREYSCDDLVARFQYDPVSYASALLSLEKSRQIQTSLAMSAIGGNRFLLLERIKRLTGQKNNVTLRDSKGILLAGLSLLLPLIMILPAHFPEPQAPKAIGPMVNPVFAARELKSSHRLVIPGKKGNRHKSLAKNNEPLEEQGFYLLNEDGQNALTRFLESDNGPQKSWQISVRRNKNSEREFSLLSPALAYASRPAAGDYTMPFVPKASFSYQIQMDSLVNVPPVAEDWDASASAVVLESLSSLANVDWGSLAEKISIAKPGNNLDQLQHELEKSLHLVPWTDISLATGPVFGNSTILQVKNGLRKIILGFNLGKQVLSAKTPPQAPGATIMDDDHTGSLVPELEYIIHNLHEAAKYRRVVHI